MPTRIVVRLCLAVLLTLTLVLPGCNGKAERQQLRAELDEEFERETHQIIEEAEQLHKALDALIEEHGDLDASHRTLEAALEGIALSEEDQQRQAAHRDQESKHRDTIEETRALLARFETAKQEHQQMEAQHGDVSVEHIQVDHDRFEAELLEFRTSMKEQQANLDLAREEMKATLASHDTMRRTYLDP